MVTFVVDNQTLYFEISTEGIVPLEMCNYPRREVFLALFIIFFLFQLKLTLLTNIKK